MRLSLTVQLVGLAALLCCCCLNGQLSYEYGADLLQNDITAGGGSDGDVVNNGGGDSNVANFTGAGERKVYLVYMRSRQAFFGNESNDTAATHLRLLCAVLGSARRARKSLIYSYKHAFNGFAAVLRENHITALAAMKDDVLRIVPCQTLQLSTTHSWDFLGLPTADATDIGVKNPSIIGVLDTSVWPRLPSFVDTGIGPVPAKWRGVCNGGQGFLQSYCNRKLIGVRYYNAGWRAMFGRLPSESADAFDRNSHGTHVASTAGGHVVTNTQILGGLVSGTARGGNHMARLAIYKIYWEDKFVDADLLAAMDDAISDGVDIINLSLGEAPEKDYLINPIAIASFRAMQQNILTVCAAGNSGPLPSTITNTAPWILTVAAVTTSRSIITPIQLQNQGSNYTGFSILLSSTTPEWYELVFGESISILPTTIGIANARHCRLNSLDPRQATGRIVLCEAEPNGNVESICANTIQLGVTGVIIVSDATLNSMVTTWPPFVPCTSVSSLVGSQILNYIRSTSRPMARIFSNQVLFNTLEAPTVAGFSSRGPNTITQNLLKPDIAAPGVDILAGYSPLANDRLYTEYGLMSGTSMAAPHVSAAASLVRAYQGFTTPWSPAAIKSALMTTAAFPIPHTDGGGAANPLDYGSGCLQPLAAIRSPGPGLIYNADVNEYIRFLCNMGYRESEINAVFLTPPLSASCRGEDDPALISQVNLPSIAIAELRGVPVSIRRTVTNVGNAQSTYTPTIIAPRGVSVTVSPSVLQFSTSETRLTYTVTFQRLATWPQGTSVFGAITWSDGTHRVSSLIAINSIASSSTNLEDTLSPHHLLEDT